MVRYQLLRCSSAVPSSVILFWVTVLIFVWNLVQYTCSYIVPHQYFQLVCFKLCCFVVLRYSRTSIIWASIIQQYCITGACSILSRLYAAVTEFWMVRFSSGNPFSVCLLKLIFVPTYLPLVSSYRQIQIWFIFVQTNNLMYNYVCIYTLYTVIQYNIIQYNTVTLLMQRYSQPFMITRTTSTFSKST